MGRVLDLSIEIISDYRWSATYGNIRPIIRQITVEQNGVLPPEDIEVFPKVSFEFPLEREIVRPWIGSRRIIQARGEKIGEAIHWDRVNLEINRAIVGMLREKVLGDVVVELINAQTNEILSIQRQQFEFMAANEWRNEKFLPEALAAFVLPSDPFVKEILVKARELLQKRTGDSSTEGYQSESFHHPSDTTPFQDHSRAYQIAHAVYDAMSAQNYSYSNPQGNFDDYSQRVRTPSQVKVESCATCLDSAVLMAACFAEAGLEPVLVLIKGHAFAGYFTGRAMTDMNGSFIPHPSHGGPIIGDDAVHKWKYAVIKDSALVRNDRYQEIQWLLAHNHIQLVETTTTTTGLAKPFHEACQNQNNFSFRPTASKDDSSLESIIIVGNAWQAGIQPPGTLHAPDLKNLEDDFRRFQESTSDANNSLKQLEDALFGDQDLPETQLSPEEKAIPPRIRQWMASLIDLGSRNPLLKMKPNQIMEFELPPFVLGQIDDLLHTPKKKIELASLSSVPGEWIHKGVTAGDFESWMKKQIRLVYPSYTKINGIHNSAVQVLAAIRGNVDDPIHGVSKSYEKEIRAIRSDRNHPFHKMSDAQLIKQFREGDLLTLDGQLAKNVKRVQEKAKEVMLATGNNSLYLTLGSISWTEASNARGKNSTASFSAPMYLYPVILEGGKGSPFTLRLDPNGYATPNYCLHEKLKRAPYNIDLQELVNPKMDDKGIDFDEMLAVITQRLRVAKLDNFAIQPRAALGVFNYSTFRLWKDLKDGWAKMCAASPVVKHLTYSANQNYVQAQKTPEPRLEPHLPIAADDSQKEAVQWALDGLSFRLEGPPGTGKSQTITNLLASCIAVNKKVLFVAEKQTALNAVKDRLDACGLGKYTLNLHAKGDSDNKLRKNISDALTVALQQRIDPEDRKWDDLAFRIKNEEEILDKYRESIHQESENGFSIWGSNEELIPIGYGPNIEIPAILLNDWSTKWPLLREICFEIENALEIVVDPNLHIWNFVNAQSISESNFAKLNSLLKQVFETFSRLEKEISGLNLEIFSPYSASLSKFSTAIQLKTDGAFTNSADLRDQTKDSKLSYATKLRGEEGGVTHEFISQARHISKTLAPYADQVSPTLLDRTDLSELRALLLELNSSEINKTSETTLGNWSQLALEADKLSKVVFFALLSETEIKSLNDAIRVCESTVDEQPLTEIVLKARLLQERIKQHQQNVSSEFLARTDLPNIGLLVGEAENAGALTKRKRYKELRLAMGTQAIAIDDRMLLLSLKEMIPMAQEAKDISIALRTQFPDLYTERFQAWNSLFSDALITQYREMKVLRVRGVSSIQHLIADDETFLRHIKELIALSEKVYLAIANLHEKLPFTKSGSYKPWETSEAKRLKSEIEFQNVEKVRKLVGADVLTTDNSRLLEALEIWLSFENDVKSLVESLGNTFLPGYSRTFRPWIESDVDDLENVFRKLHSFSTSLSDSDLDQIDLVVNSNLTSLTPSLFMEAAESWDDLCGVVEINQEKMPDWLNGRSIFELVRSDFPVLLRDGGPHDRFLELVRWKALQVALNRLGEIDLLSHGDRIMSKEIDVHTFMVDIRRSVLYHSLRERMLDGNLDRFDRKIHERRIATFEAALNESQALLKSRIPGLVNSRHLARQLPTGNNVGATNSLLNGLKPVRGEKTPIRDLISKYGSALSDAIPCFLMSPDSVATLIPVGSIDFDLVIFDEASQIRTANAIGALGRGKSGIVVGDSRQMPPATAFASNSGVFIDDESEDEEDEIEIDDLGPDGEMDEGLANILKPVAARDAESILSEYYEAQLPHMQLLCHYRSKDEVLISFSNTYIYESPMLTFPSIKGIQSKALEFRLVEGGFFERNKDEKPIVLPNGESYPSLRTNLPEAIKIVEEVQSRLRDTKRSARRQADPERKAESIIVVTFNIQQKNLISELLRTSDAQLYEAAISEPRVSEDSEETFPPQLKIRNLENVQGDEAETVIFSVAFSATKEGKFPLNWGPVSQTGGDRRLNVAVTRAQNEMIVFASFLPDQMQSLGKKLRPEMVLLKKFFDLALNGPNRIGDIGVDVQRSQHIEQIANALRDRGLKVQTKLGLSTLRVDLAVKNAESEDWELAIMVDDSCWSERGSTFQREILPRQILPKLGWKKVLRIWMPSWLNDPAEILAEIDAFFAGQHIPEVEAEVLTPLPVPEGKVTAPLVSEGLFTNFVAFSGPQVDGRQLLDEALDGKKHAKDFIFKQIELVLNFEAPIQDDRLAKTVLRNLSFGRISPERITDILSFIPRKQFTKDPIGRFVWSADQDPLTWQNYRISLNESTRSADEISSYEYINALVDIVNRQRAVNHENAVRELGATFGFRKINANVRDIIEVAIKRGLKNDRFVLIEGEYRPIT